MTDKQEDKLWDIYLPMFKDIQEWMNLSHWKIGIQGTDELPNGVTGRLESADFTYMYAQILFSRKDFFRDKINFAAVTEIIIHEMLHIFTGTASSYFRDDINKQNMLRFMSGDFLGALNNSLTNREEIMTNLLDKVLIREYIKTKEYIKYNKEFKKYQATLHPKKKKEPAKGQ